MSSSIRGGPWVAPVVENGSATAANLTVNQPFLTTNTYAGVIQDGAGGGSLGLILLILIIVLVVRR